jgi:hypothetical protein
LLASPNPVGPPSDASDGKVRASCTGRRRHRPHGVALVVGHGCSAGR